MEKRYLVASIEIRDGQTVTNYALFEDLALAEQSMARQVQMLLEAFSDIDIDSVVDFPRFKEYTEIFSGNGFIVALVETE